MVGTSRGTHGMLSLRLLHWLRCCQLRRLLQQLQLSCLQHGMV